MTNLELERQYKNAPGNYYLEREYKHRGLDKEDEPFEGSMYDTLGNPVVVGICNYYNCCYYTSVLRICSCSCLCCLFCKTYLRCIFLGIVFVGRGKDRSRAA